MLNFQFYNYLNSIFVSPFVLRGVIGITLPFADNYITISLLIWIIFLDRVRGWGFKWLLIKDFCILYYTYGKMPSRKRSRRSRSRKRVSRSRLADKKVNTLVEKRIVELAQKVHDSNIVKLIDRKYIFANYNSVTNVYGDGLKMDYEGQVVPLTRIRLADIEMVGAIGNPDIPETMQDESNPPGPEATGLAVGALDATKHGFRSADFIKVQGFSLKVRALVDRVQEGSSPLYDNSCLFWRIVLVRSDEDNLDPDWEPTADALLPLHSWGYSAKLDLQEAEATANLRCRTLLKGSMALRPRIGRSDQKNKSQFVRFKKPILISYKPGSQTGMDFTKGQIFLVARSNIPVAASFDVYKPQAAMCCKMFYTDV